jgi:hypothetical protein
MAIKPITALEIAKNLSKVITKESGLVGKEGHLGGSHMGGHGARIENPAKPGDELQKFRPEKVITPAQAKPKAHW